MRVLPTLLIAASLGAAGHAVAQTWTRDAGHGYVNTSVTVLNGQRFHDATGESHELPTTYRQLAVGVYGEVGAIDRWLTLTLDGEIYRRSELEDQGLTQGLGDLRVGAWTGLVVAPVRLTVGAMVKLPTGDNRPDPDGVDVIDRPGARDVSRSLPTGEGAVVVEPAVRVGHSFGGAWWPLRHFAEGGLGWQARVDGADAWTWKAKLGTKVPVTVLDHVWWVVSLDGQHTTLPEDEPTSGGATGLGEGVSVVGLALQAHVDFNGIGVFGGVSTAFLARRIIAGRPYQLGVFAEF